MKGNAACKTFILLQKFLHLLRISCKNDNDLIPVILHLLHNGIDCLGAIRAVVFYKRIRLIDKQNAATRRLKFTLNNLCCPADVLSDQILPAALDNVAIFQHETDAGKYTLKKTGSKEAQIYAQYLSKGEFHVPQYVGMRQAEDADWICMKYVEGNDMRDMTDETTEKAAETLSKIQSYFWTPSMDKAPENEVEQRFVEYWKRVLRRASSVADDPILRKAYQMFLDRQLTCPCTMSNGDFLQWNVIYDGENVVMIDWGFGGMMPYSLDIARFLAHATETRSAFPFYMINAQKELFLDRMYEPLKTKISR